MTEKSNRQIKTAPFRMSFVHLLAPRKDETTGRTTYQMTMLFPPNTDLKPFKAAMAAAMEDKFGADRAKWPKLKRGPGDVIRDAKDYSDQRVLNKKSPLAGYDAGWLFVRTSATEKYPPGVVGPIKGADGKFPVVTDAREVYSGRWARATLEAYYYPQQGGGVTFGLRNVQLLKHDTNLGGAVSAPEGDFEDAPEEMLGDDFDKGAAATGGAKADDDGWN